MINSSGESLLIKIRVQHIQPGVHVKEDIADDIVDFVNSKLYPCKLTATLEEVYLK